MPFLSVERVSKRFDGVTAVARESFAADRGEVVGFLGPNGAGQSTTMRLITQYYEPDTGEIRLAGVPLAAAARAAKRRIGYLPENNPLYGDMVVSEYLAFIADLRELRGPARSQAIDDAVTGTGLETVYYRPIGELSKGFRQRVGLAQAILHRPDLLVFDEPTEGLDPNQRVEIRRLIAELGKARTVIDRKSTRLNSSHSQISYAVFCLKKTKRDTAMVCPATVLTTLSLYPASRHLFLQLCRAMRRRCDIHRCREADGVLGVDVTFRLPH